MACFAVGLQKQDCIPLQTPYVLEKLDGFAVESGLRQRQGLTRTQRSCIQRRSAS
ncbi:hypothetical protein RSK20926_06587 [Roseobacter sp. SK209-2-6]|nr:hypothetical protein RSK20926_06587 [Roseobacter sp. SK209-2-6]